jgi:hypothetical protein
MKMYIYVLLFLVTGMCYAMEEKAQEKTGFFQKIIKKFRSDSIGSSSGTLSYDITTSTISSGTRGSSGNMSPRSSNGATSPRVRFNDDSNQTYIIDSDPDERANMASPRGKKKLIDDRSVSAEKLLAIAGVIELPVSQAYYIGSDAHDVTNSNNSSEKNSEAIDELTTSLKSLTVKSKKDDDDDDEYFD